jgi:hypothetical protein
LGGSSVDGIPLHFVIVTEGEKLKGTQSLVIDAPAKGEDATYRHLVSAEPQQFSTLFEANGAKSGASPLYVLADGWGIVRAFYVTATPDLSRVEADLHSVAREVHNAGGVNRYAYEAVHLFLCHNNIVEAP